MRHGDRSEWVARALLVGAALVIGGLYALPASAPATGHDVRRIPVRDTAADEFRGFEGSGFLGWTQNSRKARYHYNVFLQGPHGKVMRLNRPGTQAFGGGIAGTRVLYEEERNFRGRLVLYDTSARTYTDLPITGNLGAGVPTIAGAWILFTRGVRGGETSVWLYNRITGESHRVARIRPKQGKRRFVYSGQVSGNWAAWGRVRSRRQDVFLTNVTTGKTLSIKRPPGVRNQFDPAVAPSGTVFFERNEPCRRLCHGGRGQLVEQRRTGHPRVLLTLRKGQNAGYMYAASGENRTRLLYGRFRDLPNGNSSYGDIFALIPPR